MSYPSDPFPNDALVVQPDEVEHVSLPDGEFRLLADGSHTAGAIGMNRLLLGEGADGAQPHYHAKSTELFYVVGGVAEFLLGSNTVRVEAGGLVVVPPGMAHAFGAAPGSRTDLLIVLTPGVDRFAYFRTLGRIRQRLATFASLLPLQEHYDVHFLDTTAWQAVRAQRTPQERS